MFIILTIAFTLILFAIIPIIWKLFKGMLLLPFKICFPTRPTEHDYYAEDSSAIWLEGANGRYFRYDLENDTESQMDDLKEFYREHKDKETVNV